MLTYADICWRMLTQGFYANKLAKERGGTMNAASQV
jgi:hypothetical protein